MDSEVFPQEIEPSISFPINVDNTLGAMFIGAFIDAMYTVFNALSVLPTYACRSLYGILSLQCYIFFNIFSKDMKLLKASVRGSISTLWLYLPKSLPGRRDLVSKNVSSFILGVLRSVQGLRFDS